MKRCLLVVAAVGAMIAVAALAQQQNQPLLLLQWAQKSDLDTPPVAILIEMGLKDDNVRDWSGQALIRGAKVVKREGYRFRAGDRLVEPDGWQASSHRALRAPPGKPAFAKLEPIAPVGIVLHLGNVQEDAALSLTMKNGDLGKADVDLRDVIAGKTIKLRNGAAQIRLISTASPLVTAKTEDDFPAACYGPDGTLWVAYISYTVKEDERRIEPPQLKEQPPDFKKFYTPEFGDQVFVKYHRKGKWSEPIAVTGPNESLVGCGIAAEGNGDVWVVFSASRKGRHNIFGCRLRSQNQGAVQVGRVQMLTGEAGPNLHPVLCTTQRGELRLVYQRWSQAHGMAHISLLNCKNGAWREGLQEEGIRMPAIYFSSHESGTEPRGQSAGGPVNAWHPALTAGPYGNWVLAHDAYTDGNYDVTLHQIAPRELQGPLPVSESSRFQARPSICYDRNGCLWIAYEEGPEGWGKDYGALDSEDGAPLYSSRSVRVVCLQDGKLFKPVADLPTSNVEVPKLPFDAIKTSQYERASRYAYPKIGIDGKGRVWLTYRRNFGTRYSSHPGAIWMTFARRLDGDRWSEEIELHHSDGLLDHRPVLLPHKSGGLLVVHNTDGRSTTPETIDNDIYLSYLDLPGEPTEPKLVPHGAGQLGDKSASAAKNERAAIERMRKYRVEAGGKKYQLLRGEYHRHTEISWDGSPDGSLEDMFRYAIDAAGMDWIGNGDHDNGAGREYSWWLTQKLTDAYHIPGRFTPMFTYERSVSYPHGHRNVMFAQRGVRTLPRLAPAEGEKAVAGVSKDDTKMLYRYLHELGGICAVHTSATGMGTDWRDNDPKAEPIVEIYQGDRMSYEYPGAPRAGYDPKSDKLPANVGGWQPAGFINNAFDKGYKLAFQASSDHWSTHISYFVILAERFDRQGMLDAVKKRHCYGATDNIVVDWRCGDAIQGDEVSTRQAPTFTINVHGTGDLAKIDILRDSEVINTLTPPGGQSLRATWTDPRPREGTHYYYIRVLQRDNEIAWASPIWVTLTK
jgi:hypothetical protein